MLLQHFVDRLRLGSLPPTHAVTQSLAAIAAREPAVRAWTHVAPQQTLLAQAQGVDPGLPLAGVPFGVKDIIDVAGMPTRCGSNVTPDAPRAYDAACVDMLRRAGAIPLGKTVTAEFAFKAPGPTTNPHNPAHTPGGSSSGSAAAVAAGMAPFALGTQTGGSMIRPAAYCGVVGFKPSFGLVPRDGMKLTCESLDVIGWYGAELEDVACVARVLLPDPAMGTASAGQGPLRVVLIPGAAIAPVQPEAEQALEQAASALRQAGHAVRTLAPFAQAGALLQAHATIMEYELARNIAPVARLHGAGLSPQLEGTVRRGLGIGARQYREARQLQASMQRAWDALAGEADLIVTASAGGTAPAGLGHTGDGVFNKIWSLLGWPSLHLPLARAAGSGLPVGVQLVGRHGQDALFLALAARLRDALRAHVSDRQAA
ncbi:amidase [Orrella sp. JC864]|uniref:amidase n=1 Tax=Orrella sp. JC864 TaxID=3120298 RepID=UPI003008AB4C